MKNIIVICCLLSSLYPLNTLQAQPTRKWATYYGWYAAFGNYNQRQLPSTIIYASLYDKGSGYLYVTGSTTDSAGIATPGSFKSEFHSQLLFGSSGSIYQRNAFVAKFDTAGNRIWATYYGGNRDVDYPALAIDTAGNVYLAGGTNSDSGIATTGSHQADYPGQVNVTNPGYSSYVPFLVKFNSSGQRIWGTYYGERDGMTSFGGGATSVTYDPHSDCIYIVGSTTDTAGIATPGSFKAHLTYVYDPASQSWLPNMDAFVAKFNTDGVRQWATYYGGAKTDAIFSAWVDDDGNLYAMGNTVSDTGIATPGADEEILFDTTAGGAFLVKFNSAGERQWGTYIGKGVIGFSMAGSSGNNGEGATVYVTGLTLDTTGNATANAYQSSFGGGISDMVLAKYDASGMKQWSTYFGGPGDEPINITPYYYKATHTLAIDEDNNILMIGITSSVQGMEKSCNPYPAMHQTGFITKWQPSGNLLWSSYYDGALFSVCAGAGDNFFVTGTTTYDSLATAGALQFTKIANKPSGLIARFTGDRTCPNRSFNIAVNNDQLSVDSGYAGYEWYKNGILISGADEAVYTASDTGLFYVVISDSCGCTYTSDTISLPPTGINNIGNERIHLDLYPNPNNGIFTLSGSLHTTGYSLTYTVTDISGRRIVSGSWPVIGKSFSRQLNLSYLEAGIYFLRIQRDNAYDIIKFVKNK